MVGTDGHAAGGAHSALAHPARSPWAALAGVLGKLRYLGLAGYLLEWLLEASHVSHRLHRLLHKLHSPKVQLLAITMVLAGHLAEHLHQEEENHHQEHRLAALEARLAAVLPASESKKAH
mmetsp:Transcript_46702/g.144290  ORF Transcript_46702/g.144290 Transcript_46702/m.144290 type:complete len:120 (+) Transcript_46702:31-390(+)